MTHEDDSSKVNSEIDSITIEQWEVLYENIYIKYKKLKHENKSLKIKITAHENLKDKLKKTECTLVEYDSLKIENESLINKIALLEVDNASLIDKLSSSMNEIEDLKSTLGKFVKGKNTLDTMLGMKVNY